MDTKIQTDTKTTDRKSVKKSKKRYRKILRILLIILLVLAGASFFLIRKLMAVSYPALPSSGAVKPDVWYEVSTDTGAASDGSDWHGLYRKGTENKLLIHFFGGGVSLFGEMDEQNGSEEEFFYSTTVLQDVVVQLGIFSEGEENPFRDWSFLAIPYATGDFHIGQSSYSWIDEEGQEVTVQHRGYTNYRELMERIRPYLGTPDALVLTGSSAGGFAASLLADDLLEYFPDTENVTVCADSSLLLYDNWKETASEFWNAPEEITERLHSNNITLDSFQALREKRGDSVKILFTCSLRDRKLQEYQNYIDSGEMKQSRRSGRLFQKNLWMMADEIEALGSSGVYLFVTGEDPVFHNTQHMLFPYDPFEKLVDGVSMADWLMDAVNGSVDSYRAES